MEIEMLTEEQMLKIKRCGDCGRFHDKMPFNVRLQKSYDEMLVEAFLWECECGSTVYVKYQEAI